jgi:hypothetical protein
MIKIVKRSTVAGAAWTGERSIYYPFIGRAKGV